MQELKLKSPTRTAVGRSLGLVVEDMDFDGIPDVRIRLRHHLDQMYLYFCWL